MLTHSALSKEQGYEEIAKIYPRSDAYIKKEDPHIKFLMEVVEPACNAYTRNKYGEMFEVMGMRTLKINNHAEKAIWTTDLNKLMELRGTSTVGDIIDHIRETGKPRVPEEVERRDEKTDELGGCSVALGLTRLRSQPRQFSSGACQSCDFDLHLVFA